MPTLEPSDARLKMVRAWDKKVIRLEDQLAKALKLLAMQTEALENELTEGLGYTLVATNPPALKSLKDITSAFNSLTDAQIRLAKTAKERAAAMTPEDERLAVMAYIRSLNGTDRGTLLKEMVRYHREVAVKGPEMAEFND